MGGSKSPADPGREAKGKKGKREMGDVVVVGRVRERERMEGDG